MVRFIRPVGISWWPAARIINNSWGIGITEKFDKGGYDPAYPHFTVNDAQKQFDQIKQILGTKHGGAYQGAIDAARSGVVTIFAAGNDYNLNNPDAMAGWPILCRISRRTGCRSPACKIPPIAVITASAPSFPLRLYR